MLVFPNAKINLGLDILRKRADGYHDISTLMMPVGWRDALEIIESRGDADTLMVTGRPVDCPPEKNLVMKAVRALREVAEFPPVEIHLNKVIPDGAGLGGGSADAAFTLSLLNDMFALGMKKRQLAEIAGHLGADCSFFIYNEPMICEGIGTRMHALVPSGEGFPWAGLHAVIVKPDVSVPTAAAYSAVTPREPEISIETILRDYPVEKWQGLLKNDFEQSVFARFPKIESVKKALIDSGAVYASMSGSGSSVFGLFSDQAAADRSLRRFAQDFDAILCSL